MKTQNNFKMKNLHVGHLFTDYYQGTTFLFHIDNPNFHLVGLRGRHDKVSMIKFYETI